MMKRKRDMNHVSSRPAMNNKIMWQPPYHSFLKLNVDDCLYIGGESFALGMVVRDEKGCFVTGKNMRVQGTITVMEAKARSVQEAISWIEEMGLHHVPVECDSELVVNAVNNEISYYLEIGHILEFCRLKFKSRTDLFLCHLKKQANRAAHLMARVPCLLDSYNLFLSPPSLLLETLSSNMFQIKTLGKAVDILSNKKLKWILKSILIMSARKKFIVFKELKTLGIL